MFFSAYEAAFKAIQERLIVGFDFRYFISFKDVRSRRRSSSDCSCGCAYDFSFTFGVIRTDSIPVSESIQWKI